MVVTDYESTCYAIERSVDHAISAGRRTGSGRMLVGVIRAADPNKGFIASVTHVVVLATW